MQKTRNKRIFDSCVRLQLIFSVYILSLGSVSVAQSEKSTFNYYSYDSLLITADEYLTSDTLPYIIFIHDQGSSRGEFSDIIDRFQKMNFNCFAIDARNGGNSNFLGNETANRCRANGYNRATTAVEADILASVKFVFEKSGKNVILLGAGANGSLALKIAKENPFVRAAIALSPGEYFLPNLNIEATIAGMEKPLLITCSRQEFPYQQKIVSKVAEEYKTIFAPEEDEGARGTNALLPNNASSGDYWIALLLFFKDLQ